MIDPTILLVLQLLMLATDGVGIFASFTIAMYYRVGQRDMAIRLLYYFFAVMTLVFIMLTGSDALVIAGVPQTWATTPIVRGLTFRLPIALIELWIIHKQHTR